MDAGRISPARVDSPTPRTKEEKGAMVERFASIA
jgi:hypothetical protein